ncbi:MAG: hypothetical protein PHQ43_15990 [Dehalococcoidales bacterium]|nr:hypothetical protein [Dehalococcoidales bacterium]
MEKWRDDIEKVLANNPTVDRWIIRDLVQRENPSCQMEFSIILKCMMIVKTLLLIGPGDVSDPEVQERMTRSLTEAGWSREMADGFIDRLKAGASRLPRPGAREATEGDISEASGDDE